MEPPDQPRTPQFSGAMASQMSMAELPPLNYAPEVKGLILNSDSFTAEVDSLFGTYEQQAPAESAVFVRRARINIVAFIAALEREADVLADMLLEAESKLDVQED